MATPEKLSLWDRLFNRYRREIVQQGQTECYHAMYGVRLLNSEHVRDWVLYKVIDRVTGSEELEKVYLN